MFGFFFFSFIIVFFSLLVGRPCKRCIKKGCESSCVDGIRKRASGSSSHHGNTGQWAYPTPSSSSSSSSSTSPTPFPNFSMSPIDMTTQGLEIQHAPEYPLYDAQFGGAIPDSQQQQNQHQHQHQIHHHHNQHSQTLQQQPKPATLVWLPTGQIVAASAQFIALTGWNPADLSTRLVFEIMIREAVERCTYSIEGSEMAVMDVLAASGVWLRMVCNLSVTIENGQEKIIGMFVPYCGSTNM